MITNWSRMCKSMPDCDSIPCPMFHSLGVCMIPYAREADWEHVEQIIDNWAESNPKNPHYQKHLQRMQREEEEQHD